jgi:phosphoenolpyruvate carboxykinase (GTP)
MRVLRWIVERVEGRGRGSEHLFGVTPRYQDLDWSGLGFSAADFERVTSIDANQWKRELALHDELFARLSNGLPPALREVRSRLERSLPV